MTVRKMHPRSRKSDRILLLFPAADPVDLATIGAPLPGASHARPYSGPPGMLNMFFPGISHTVTGKLSPKMKRVRPERACAYFSARISLGLEETCVNSERKGGMRGPYKLRRPRQVVDTLPASSPESDARAEKQSDALHAVWIASVPLAAPVPATRPTSAVTPPYLLPGLPEGYHHPYYAPISFIIVPPESATEGVLPVSYFYPYPPFGMYPPTPSVPSEPVPPSGPPKETGQLATGNPRR
ncbi:hypothetical protein B0H11DRAFT_2186388 [Mycena galericulata]|nr:hypothetical protein B0H11DRAFT_2186388 [Mycena galericulata]